MWRQRTPPSSSSVVESCCVTRLIPCLRPNWGYVHRSPTPRSATCSSGGGGPAGLPASGYGASDGLEVTTVNAMAVGGQASTTSRIENYLGFPAGISGAELTERAGVQAARFGARVIVPAAVTALTSAGDHFRTELDGHDQVRARALIVASGARYRRLDVPGLARFETANVYYEATVNERHACGVEPVAVIGGGNSAGQAAV